MSQYSQVSPNAHRILENIRLQKACERAHLSRIDSDSSLPTHIREQVLVWDPVFAAADRAALFWMHRLERKDRSTDTPSQIAALFLKARTQTRLFVRQLGGFEPYPTLLSVILACRNWLGDETTVRDCCKWLEDEATIPDWSLWLEDEAVIRDCSNWLVDDTPHPKVLQRPSPTDESLMPNGQNELPYTPDIHSSLPQQSPSSAGSRPHLTATGEGTWSFGLPQNMPPSSTSNASSGALPPLPYSYDSLEPYMNAETLRTHHDEHHREHAEGLRHALGVLRDPRSQGSARLHWRREVAYHAEQNELHRLLWSSLSPKGGGTPDGPLLALIKRDFGSFPSFQTRFETAARQVKGSGWVVLVWNPSSMRLQIRNAETPFTGFPWNSVPLLALDLWEHAYYLQYRSDRENYISAWWNLADWDGAGKRLPPAPAQE